MRQRTYYMADTENNVPKSRLYQDSVNRAGHADEEGHLFSSTMTDDGFTATRVWGACIAPVKEDVEYSDAIVVSNVKDFISICRGLPGRGVTVYFHNLAYDGPLILSHLKENGYTRSLAGRAATERELELMDDYEAAGNHEAAALIADNIEKREKQAWRNPEKGTYKTVISDDGTWYSFVVTFHHGGKTVDFRDSLKILPFSVDTIGKALKTRAQKLVGEIDYSKYRDENYQMTPTEEKYIVNDVLVMAEALGKLASREVNLLESLTIGSACMKEYYKSQGSGNVKLGKGIVEEIFPVLEDDAEIRKAYHGGFCYVKAGSGIIDLRNEPDGGYVHDVNSLYPSVMYRHRYPMGHPTKWEPSGFELMRHDAEYVVAMAVDFSVKSNHIPFVQVKGSIWQDNEHISVSDGPIHLTFTRPEYELFLEQYDVHYMDVLDFWVFAHVDGPFDTYIETWYDLKKNADNPVDRMIAKLMLNNLYGKMAQSSLRNSGIPVLDENGVMRYEVEHSEYGGGHIACGAYITAYAKAVTVRAAQANYDIFLYADTDSLHTSSKPTGIDVGNELGQWALESKFDVARYVRQKTYIENITHEDKGGVITPVEPHIDIKAAGAPNAVKTRLLYDVTSYDHESGWTFRHLTKDENDHITDPKRPMMEVFERFTFGLTEAGKLRRRAVKGGTVLEETTFKIHPVDGVLLDPYTGLSAEP